jgi:hypothetical protein
MGSFLAYEQREQEFLGLTVLVDGGSTATVQPSDVKSLGPLTDRQPLSMLGRPNDRSFGISHLPVETLHDIFCWISVKDLISVRTVGWLDALSSQDAAHPSHRRARTCAAQSTMLSFGERYCGTF